MNVIVVIVAGVTRAPSYILRPSSELAQFIIDTIATNCRLVNGTSGTGGAGTVGSVDGNGSVSGNGAGAGICETGPIVHYTRRILKCHLQLSSASLHWAFIDYEHSFGE